MGHSTPSGRGRKARGQAGKVTLPPKPYPEFPLQPHNRGCWMKKIRGKLHYFGRWGRKVGEEYVRLEGDEWWRPALELYQSQRDDLMAGRTPRVRAGGLTVSDLCNAYLNAKLRQQQAGELTTRSFMELRNTTDMLIVAFGKARLVDDLAADDFARLRATMAERWGPVRLGNAITRVKGVFKYGVDNGLIEKAVRYGSEFRKPGKATMRRHRAQAGGKMLEAAQVRRLLDAPDVQMKAMVLLAVNCGFGNGDCATLPLEALDLERGWVDYPRPKTGIARRCWLWAETVAALRAALAERPEPKPEAEGLVFVNTRGSGWIHFTASGGRVDNVTIQFTLLLKGLGLHRAGLGFYTLRHVFRTVADEARDPVAIDLIMGHADHTMGAHYRERVADARLRAVAEHVRQWIFPGATGAAPAPG